jgi:hypothetical protein
MRFRANSGTQLQPAVTEYTQGYTLKDLPIKGKFKWWPRFLLFLGWSLLERFPELFKEYFKSLE